MWHTNQTVTQFVAQVENFTVMFKHSVQQLTFGYHATASDMYGWLQVGSKDAEPVPRQNALCKRYNLDKRRDPRGLARMLTFNGTGAPTDTAPCLVPPNLTAAEVDFFELETLLDASGISLDDIQPTFYSKATPHSYRYAGTVLLVNIEYQNTRPWSGMATDTVVPGPTGSLRTTAPSATHTRYRC